MASEITSRRVPWIALALSLLSAGVGHVYCGRFAKGLSLYFAWMIVPICGGLAAMGQPSMLGLALLLLPVFVVFIVYVYAAVDAWRVARQIGSDYSLRHYNRASIYWLLIIAQLVLFIGMTAVFRGFVYEAYVIPVNNMSPTVIAGDRILARQRLPQDYFPQRGDLIIYRNPTPEGAARFMGRVVAMAGDEVEIRGERLIINGKELNRERVPDESLQRFGQPLSGRVAYEVNSGHRYLVTYGDSTDPSRVGEDLSATIPAGHVFVLGDNRDRSRDSRHFGSIRSGEVVGCVDYIYWPAGSWSRLGVADGGLP